MSSEILAQVSYSTTSSTTRKGGGPLLVFSLVVTLLMIVNIYFLIKYFINYRKSIDKTQKVLGEYLVKDYVQGASFKNNSFFNFLIIIFTILAQIFVSAIALKRAAAEIDQLYVPVFIFSYEVALILLGSLIIGFFVLRYVKFNYPQYKSDDVEIYNELVSLRELKNNELQKQYPQTISLDLEKLKASNLLLHNLFNKWTSFYNTMEGIPFKKQYNIFLDQLFKINYFIEVNTNIEKTQELNREVAEVYDFNNPKLSLIEREVLWMKHADKKAKILKETEELSKMSKEEFDKKYSEYVYSARSIDPLYQPASRNAWLFYRDSEIEDLFYNTNVTINYSLDNQNETIENSMPEFLNQYRSFLISKFLLNITLEAKNEKKK
ncbi:ABC transporter permease [Mycoplasma enhydrae]|uniref:ABC transporter permease n=1 Tax=Mycoplasma enhydrae TaxID=2499220 RepID=UPI00197C4117|nr:ABC transporter permease [Mycoplasma enhydrae]MBN4089545.1 ABC transporter permease [Mycoplasma enhydrae]MCV3733522.1 ABC transporter permease [Mycoplasma enhydrae]MCV3753230.1 ABC transporter permease [Mycoplasma enhydrae]